MTPEEAAMERLAELRQSISEMTDEQLQEIIGTSRNNRLPKAKPKATAKAKEPKEPKVKKEKTTGFGGLTPEMAQAILDKLGK